MHQLSSIFTFDKPPSFNCIIQKIFRKYQESIIHFYPTSTKWRWMPTGIRILIKITLDSLNETRFPYITSSVRSTTTVCITPARTKLMFRCFVPFMYSVYNRLIVSSDYTPFSNAHWDYNENSKKLIPLILFVWTLALTHSFSLYYIYNYLLNAYFPFISAYL